MKKRNIIAFVVAVALVLLSAVGTAVAYMIRTTEAVKNQFEPAVVDCAMTNGTVSITNTGTIDAYLRIRFVTYWVDVGGNVVDKPSGTLNVALADGWIAGSDYTYYYEKAVAPWASMALLKEGKTITLASGADGTKQVLEVFGEAIQSQPAKAAQSAWGVTISNGIITSAP